MRNIRASGRDVALPPLKYLGQQALMMAPQTLPFWLSGLGFYFFSRRAAAYRMFGWAFVLTIAFFMADARERLLFRAGVSDGARGWRSDDGRFFSSRRDSQRGRNCVPDCKARYLRCVMLVSLLLRRWFCPSFRLRSSLPYKNGSVLSLHARRRIKSACCCLNTMRTNSAGRRWWSRLRGCITRCRPKSRRRPRFIRRIMARRARSISLARAMDCRKRSARIRIIFSGDRANTRAKS